MSESLAERSETTEFTTTLRRELERRVLTGARQQDLDRVFELEFGEGEEERTLVVELMPPGNILVVGPGGTILAVEEEVRAKNRRLVRGGLYHPPLQRRASPGEVTAEAVGEAAAKEETVGRAIGRHIGLPRKYVQEVLRRLSLEEDAPSSELEPRAEEVAFAIRGLVQEARSSPTPCVCEEGGAEEVYVVRPAGLEVKRDAKTVSALCDSLFLEEIVSAAVEGDLSGRRKQLEAGISRLQAEEASLRSSARAAREAAAAASSSGSAEAARRVIEMAGLKPERRPGSPEAAASLLYDWAKKYDRKAGSVSEAAKRLSRKMKAEAGESRSRKPLVRAKKEWFERFRWFLTSSGKLAVGGRDAQSNSNLVRRHTQDGDTVYHADLFGSPFFVLKSGREQTEADEREVAQATVAFSSAWKTGLGSADAYWVEPEQVSQTAPSGEYLARGSFAIKGRKNFVRRNLVELAVGVDGEGRVVAGPESAVSASLQKYVVLSPHKEKGSDTAKKVARDLEALSQRSDRPPVDDVLRALPSGGGKVVRRVGGGKAPE